MKNLTTNTENDSTQKHYRENILKSTKTVYCLAKNTDWAGDYKNDSGTNFIDKHSSN